MYIGGIDKASIVDVNTGNVYEARGSYDPQVWNRGFNINAPIGTVLDFPVEFPLLPKDVKKIAIYGIPLCNLNGLFEELDDYSINIRDNNFNGYDETPHLKVPRLIKEESANYDRNDWDTWAAYSDVHTVRPCKDGTIALWRTPEATYLTFAYEQNWRTEYFAFDNSTLVDCATGMEYKLREVQGFPNNRHLFMAHGEPGTWVCFTKVYDPLPLSTQNIVLTCENGGKPVDEAGFINDTFYVNTLRSNQKYFEYFKPNIVKLNAAPMQVKTVSAEQLNINAPKYRFKVIDGETNDVMYVAVRLLDNTLERISAFVDYVNGEIVVQQSNNSAFIMLKASGYESVIMPMKDFKPGKKYTIKMKKADTK